MHLAERFPGVRDGWARFDGPAGTQMVDVAIDAMTEYLRSGDNANSHGVFAASIATGELVGRARNSVGRLLCADPDTVAFGPNMTSLMFDFTRAVARSLRPGDEIVCTRLDHDANVTPWVLAARDAGARVVLADFDTTSGRLATDSVASLLNERTRWVAVTGASNALGTIPDISAITTAAHAVGARVLVDAVHLAPHQPIDVGAIGCDVLVCSPYKWYGPHAGVLCGRPEVLHEIVAYKVRPAADTVPERFETGTPAFEAIAATAAAAEFLLAEGVATIADHESALFAPLLDGLLAMDHVRVYGPHEHHDRTPTVAFTVEGKTPDDVARLLGATHVAVWSGNYYAVEAMDALGLGARGAVRAGVACYTTPDDVSRLLQSVASMGPP